ncbi:biosynthetic-type acetolactate synthase large subunit [Rhizobium leguminosarum]|uniref:biosynthetic-type acetolactate synthase large subunit n=1 Tax=Rhizobium leguminosarum TaxID=384 RepID=UPI000E2FC2CE
MRSRHSIDTPRAQMTGAEIVLQALRDNGVTHIFGYPGAAVLPIYDELFQQEDIRHILVRHEQGAGHAAEGYARSTGKVGVMLVTSGPGVTNAITPLQNALMDSVPLVCLAGQVPTTLIGSDAFQECDTVGITRACTKHNRLVGDVNDLAAVIHEAFRIAGSGRPGPVLVDMPKDVLFASGHYMPPEAVAPRPSYQPDGCCATSEIEAAIALMATARRPVICVGGGVINSGPEAVKRLRELTDLTGFPVTSTLMGLGAYPASSPNWLKMAGLHGSHEANMAMQDCDLMLCIGARFDGGLAASVDGFSPHSRKIQIDIDAASLNKCVRADIGIQGDAGGVLAEFLRLWRALPRAPDRARLAEWRRTIEGWRARRSFSYAMREDVIMPQYAIERLYELTKDRDTYITTEVGRHQIWAAQHYDFEQPNRWIISGGLGTMGYGLPAALGVQIANPGSLVIDIAGDASVQMTMKEMSAAVQHNAPIKIFILNGGDERTARQHGNPDFVKLAEAYGGHGIRCKWPAELDDAILEMIAVNRPVLFDCCVADLADRLPTIGVGSAHNEMLLHGGAPFAATVNVDREGLV